jgi:hypothetical protein
MRVGEEKVDEAKKYAAHQYDRICAEWVRLEAVAGINTPKPYFTPGY